MSLTLFLMTRGEQQHFITSRLMGVMGFFKRAAIELAVIRGEVLAGCLRLKPVWLGWGSCDMQQGLGYDQQGCGGGQV